MTINEFRKFCTENQIRCFCYHTRNQRVSDSDMDVALTFPPPFCAFNSDVFCFQNGEKSRMVLRRVRSIQFRPVGGTGVGEVEISCGSVGMGSERSTYTFLVS